MRLTERKSKNGGKEALSPSTGGETPYICTNVGDVLTCDCMHTLAPIGPRSN